MGLCRDFDIGVFKVAAYRVVAALFHQVNAAFDPFFSSPCGIEKGAKAIRVGDPMDHENQMGPMARADLRDFLHKQVEGSVAAVARVLCGGKPREGKGAFYMPTVLSGVTQGMPAFDETFGLS